MLKNEISRLASDEVQEYVLAHTGDDEKKLLLKHQSILGLPTVLIAQQILARIKIEAQLPLFFRTKGVVYPPSLNLEQSSSQATATFKAGIVLREVPNENLKVADLTGGFGIDSFSFSQIANSIDYVEPNPELNEIVQHNFGILKKDNVLFHCESAEDFVNKNSNSYDLVFLDPSRRDSKARKVFTLSDCAPDASALVPHLLGLTKFILIKTSPLLDIKQGLRELMCVKKVIVVSVGNECKELLFQIKKDFNDEPLIQTFNLNSDASIKQEFEFKFSEEETSTSEFSSPKKYLYEPNASILKAGAFKLAGKNFDLEKIHINTHLYTSSFLKTDFPGRIFEIEEMGFNPNQREKHANIISRNYPLSAEELKKKLKLKDGGEKYVIAFSGQEKKHVVLAKRLA
jgi:hypothetical protein